MDDSIKDVLLVLFGSGGALVLAVKAWEKMRMQLIGNRYNMEKTRTDAEIKNEMNFQERIVNKSFEAYVNQNTRMMDLFENKFDELSKFFQELNSLSRDAYAQVEILRREMKSYERASIANQRELIGKMDKMEGLENSIKIFLENMNRKENATNEKKESN